MTDAELRLLAGQLAEALEAASEFLPAGVNVVDCTKGTATMVPLPTMQEVVVEVRAALAAARDAGLLRIEGA